MGGRVVGEGRIATPGRRQRGLRQGPALAQPEPEPRLRLIPGAAEEHHGIPCLGHVLGDRRSPGGRRGPRGLGRPDATGLCRRAGEVGSCRQRRGRAVLQPPDPRRRSKHDDQRGTAERDSANCEPSAGVVAAGVRLRRDAVGPILVDVQTGDRGRECAGARADHRPSGPGLLDDGRRARDRRWNHGIARKGFAEDRRLAGAGPQQRDAHRHGFSCVQQ